MKAAKKAFLNNDEWLKINNGIQGIVRDRLNLYFYQMSHYPIFCCRTASGVGNLVNPPMVE